jgi:hypothetical protein
MIYSEEQKRYIQYPRLEDTKLLACAGSGKTACIIARINYLIQTGIVKNDEVYMLTFTKFTRFDFINKLDESDLMDEAYVATIDSFAKKFISPFNTVDVGLLSYTFFRKLDSEEFPELAKIKCIFIDEAQDLNEIQFGILKKLKEKYGIVLGFVGDPNQNIFQFRGSSDRFMMSYPAKEFHLTINFRSAKHIVEFSNYLRPYSSGQITTTKALKGEILPVFYVHRNDEAIEHDLMQILRDLVKQKVDLSDVAILAPTRGQVQHGKSRGLSLLANILFANEISFKQFYDESNSEDNGVVKYEPEKGKLNLLTYMGSKGLQWKFVIIIDAIFGLINKRHFSLDKHEHDKYLLYVACSRAIKQLFIFTKYKIKMKDKNREIVGLVNPWFGGIPRQKYDIDEQSKPYFKLSDIAFNESEKEERNLGGIISSLSDKNLYEIQELINYENLDYTRLRISEDFSGNDCFDLSFLTRLCKAIFMYKYHMKVGKPIDKIPSIDYIINDRNILDVNDEEIRGWLFKHKYLKWDEIDKLVIPDKISTFLGKLGRTIELKDYIFSLSKFYRKCVQDKKEFIREKYNEYLKGTDWRSCFWIIMFRHAIDSYHYYHIKTKGEKYKIMMDNYQELFDSFEKFFFLEFEEFNQYLSGEFTDFIDAVGKKGEIYQIRCVKHIGLKPILQSSIINYLRTKKEEFEIKFINLLTGELITIPIKFDKKIMDYLKGN